MFKGMLIALLLLFGFFPLIGVMVDFISYFFTNKGVITWDVNKTLLSVVWCFFVGGILSAVAFSIGE